jgi:hypothetical protein
VLRLSDDALGQAAGVHQSSVSRALGRKPPTFTPSLRKLCNYAENVIAPLEVTTDFEAAARSRLSESVADAWDGTPAGLNGLLAVLKALGQLRRDQQKR